MAMQVKVRSVQVAANMMLLVAGRCGGTRRQAQELLLARLFQRRGWRRETEAVTDAIW